jgi:prepilin-type N-terminal cleavage/methylation domain-containing protein/prepilin-type processing-associated H-X9-DG protein
MLRPRQGFTLIELLVVIAIIAILAAILFPVFAQAREKARQTTCLSNTKQLGLAVAQYVQDFDEAYPYGIGDGATWWDETWAITVQPYIKSLNVFICPDDSDPPLTQSWEGIGISFAANALIGPGSHCLGIMNVDQPWWETDVIRTDAQITQPSATIMIAEKHNDDVMTVCLADNPGDTGCGNISRGGGYGSLFTGFNWWDWNAPGEIPIGDCDTTSAWWQSGRSCSPTAAYPNGPNGAVSAKHAQMANFLFVDTHAKAMRPGATDPDPDNQPQNNMWNSER